MKIVASTLKKVHRAGTLAVVAASALAPMALTMSPAKADPPRDASNWSWRDRNNDRYYANDDNYYDNGRWHDRRDREHHRLYFTGRVVEDLHGNRFVMRTNSGRAITVEATQWGQVRRISRGDRVTIAGHFRNGTFIADDLNFDRDYRR